MQAFWRRLAVLALLLLPARCPAAQGFEELLTKLPEQANTLLLVDAEAIRATPLAARRQWAKGHRQNSLGDVSSLRPSIRRLAVASQFDPAALEDTWEVGVAQLGTDVATLQLAQAEAGTVDIVAGQQVVLSPRGAYYVSLAPRTAAMMRPPRRQELGRWLRFAGRNSRVRLSPYLKDAAARVGRDSPIVLAIDTADVLDPDGLRRRLVKNKALSGKAVDIGRLARTLSGLRGMLLEIHIDDALTGELRLDCDGPVKVLAPVAKPLLLEALDRLGYPIEDLNDWDTRSEAQAVVIRGKLSEQGLQRLLSPFFTPAATPEEPPQRSGAETRADPNAVASRRYFTSLTTLLEDLRKSRARDYGKLKYLFYQYSKKIDALPVLNVDEDLLKYGAQVSATLRGLAGLAGQAGSATKLAEAQQGEWYGSVPSTYYGYVNGWGYQYTAPQQVRVNNFGAVNNLIARGQATEKAIRLQTWSNMDDATLAIRRQMTAKYQTAF